MNDKEIEQKIEEIYNKNRGVAFGNTIDNLLKEAILFGQSHMKQRVIECIPEEEEFTNGMNYEQANYLNGHNEFRDQVLEAVNNL